MPFITCEELHDLMQTREDFTSLLQQDRLKPGMNFPDAPPTYSIFDLRPVKDFRASRIQDPEDVDRCVSVNINPVLITPKVTARRLEKLVCLTTEDRIQQQAIRMRSTRDVDMIVLLDWEAEESRVGERHPLMALMTILREKDPGLAPPEHRILDGGFKEWLRLYPELTSNPDVIAPEDGHLEDIEVIGMNNNSNNNNNSFYY